MSLIWSPDYAPVDGDFADVSLLLLGEGTNGSTTILDSSSNNLSVTANGDAQISTAVNTPFGTGDGVLAFDGTGDYIQTANNNDFKFGSGDFTIEYWFYGTDLTSVRQHFNTDNGLSNNSYAIITTPSGSNANVLYYLSSVGNSWDIASAISIGIIAPNIWNHIALVRFGDTFTGYLNGIAGGTAASSASLFNFTSPFVLAATSDLVSFTAGYFSNFRITKGVARYTENFTPPTAPFPILSPSTRIEVGDGFDVEAANYILAVEAADTAVLEPAVRTAINDFVVGCKSDGIWNAIKASCLLCGARTLEGALVPLKGSAPTNFNFTLSDYDRELGLKGDGSTKYLDSNRNNNTDLQDSRHLAVWRSADGDGGLLGSNGTSTGDSHLYNGFGNFITRNSSSVASNQLLSLSPSPTFYGTSRASSSSFTVRHGGVDYIALINSEIPANRNIRVFETAGKSTARIAFYSIGESLDLAKLDTRVTDLITAIGAAIP